MCVCVGVMREIRVRVPQSVVHSHSDENPLGVIKYAFSISFFLFICYFFFCSSIYPPCYPLYPHLWAGSYLEQRRRPAYQNSNSEEAERANKSTPRKRTHNPQPSTLNSNHSPHSRLVLFLILHYDIPFIYLFFHFFFLLLLALRVLFSFPFHKGAKLLLLLLESLLD